MSVCISLIMLLCSKGNTEQDKNEKLKESCENLGKDKFLLMKQIEDKNNELAKSKELIKDLKQALDDDENARDALSKQSKEQLLLQQDRNELRTLNERLRNKLSEVSSTYEKLKGASDNELFKSNEDLQIANSRIAEFQSESEQANAITMHLRDEIRNLQESSRDVQRLTAELRNSQNINKVLQGQLNDVAKASEIRQNVLDPEVTNLKRRMQECQRLNHELQEKLHGCQGNINMLKNDLSQERSMFLSKQEEFLAEVRRLKKDDSVTAETKVNMETQLKELSFVAESYKTMIERYNYILFILK